MTKIRTKHCYNINKLVRCVKILSEFSLNTLIVQEIFLSFLSFPLFFNFFTFFPDFPGLPLSAVNPAWWDNNYSNHYIKTKALLHCVKSVQIRSFFWSVFSCIRTEYGDLRSKSALQISRSFVEYPDLHT